MLETTKTLEEESLPTWLQPEGGGEAHPFADALFMLPVGDYRVCVAPLTAEGEPSRECRPDEGMASVIADATTEILLVMQCKGDPAGGLDVIAALNDPPTIERLHIEPSKFITVCERARILVGAADPNGDALRYVWSIVSQPAGSSPMLVTSGNEASFSTDTPGTYEIKVVVTDVYNAIASITFPVHVSDEDCDDPCGRELNPQCEPVQCDDGNPNTLNDACRYDNNDICTCIGE
jgi:hypothetical protein